MSFNKGKQLVIATQTVIFNAAKNHAIMNTSIII